ncbi:hypothetical protein ACIBCO_03720 [Streptomyces violascens]|uniref:hypothetical protein n=1 Tax=Streptomyces violascens TaxID=67381 RepID=UPI0037B1C44C
MIKQVLAGAAFATAATMAVAAPASAATATQAPKAPANALQNLLSSPLGPSPTTSGTGCGCIGDAVGGLTSNTPVAGSTGKLTSTVSNTTSSLTGNTNGTMGNGGSSASGAGASDFATRNGDTVITGEDGEGAGGILNTYGASLINVDGRCLVPLPEGEGIGGHGLTGPKAACNIAPVDQYEAPQKLL